MAATVFVPESLLQGENLPAHITWTGIQVSEIRVKVPRGLKLKEIYNVPKGHLHSELEGELVVTGTEIDGYVGLLFESTRLDDPFSVGTFVIRLSQPGTSEAKEFVREVALFRPRVVVSATSPVISVTSKGEGRLSLKGTLSIQNVGKGTALVAITVEDNTSVTLEPPPRLQDFVAGFIKDIRTRMEGLTKSFPQYSKFLRMYGEILGDPATPLMKDAEVLREIMTGFERAFVEDKDFVDDFVDILTTSYTRNFHLIAEIESFLQYLQMMSLRNMIILNAAYVLRIPPGSHRTSLKLWSTDLGFNQYEPIEIGPLSFTTDKEAVVPVYLLVEPKGADPGGPQDE